MVTKKLDFLLVRQWNKEMIFLFIHWKRKWLFFFHKIRIFLVDTFIRSPGPTWINIIYNSWTFFTLFIVVRQYDARKHPFFIPLCFCTTDVCVWVWPVSEETLLQAKNSNWSQVWLKPRSLQTSWPLHHLDLLSCT